MANILIVGAGWLGTPLAQSLVNEGNNVVVTRRSQEKLDELPPELAEAELLDLGQANAEIKLPELIQRYKIERIVGAFPPGFRKGGGEEYAQQWATLVNIAKQHNIEKLVMISSTTVYPNLPSEMREESASLSLARRHADFSENAQIMLEAEQSVIDSGITYAILRCSGLIGPDRNPARFAARLKQISRKAPANMLHQNDAVAAVRFSLDNLDNQTVNVTTPKTVSKAEFYQAAIMKSGSDIALPPITDDADKRIVADKLLALGYKFQFNSTLDAL
ncbi:NAD(P)H-binding protein [Vibrio alginolyticus]|uniref:NAD(P)H-binding protein n=1 Tax=Vibrio sp. B1FLJ16 TaxID=2751178 RepID=UPI0015F35295|nr:NAD(P)H-binding protein [Vibrio sp. B1FLJ16]CAD7803661.1 COG0451 Nucleoside-diphosphate-sugar epimerases [Vibrio sp. B1FLJ16]CAE6895525.1 COG0451 Nucleoside-diphosphate-sugar epimerases [Vibrio sp. B1FLJ16]